MNRLKSLLYFTIYYMIMITFWPVVIYIIIVDMDKDKGLRNPYSWSEAKEVWKEFRDMKDTEVMGNVFDKRNNNC